VCESDSTARSILRGRHSARLTSDVCRHRTSSDVTDLASLASVSDGIRMGYCTDRISHISISPNKDERDYTTHGSDIRAISQTSKSSHTHQVSSQDVRMCQRLRLSRYDGSRRAASGLAPTCPPPPLKLATNPRRTRRRPSRHEGARYERTDVGGSVCACVRRRAYLWGSIRQLT
jgi:hypothetical protein